MTKNKPAPKPNDQRSNVKNSYNPAKKAADDNKSVQKNTPNKKK